MKDFKPVTATNMLQCLQKHSKYSWAKALIEERLQDCIQHEVTSLSVVSISDIQTNVFFFQLKSCAL